MAKHKKKNRRCHHCRRSFVPQDARRAIQTCPYPDCGKTTERHQTLGDWDRVVDGLLSKLVRFVWEPDDPCWSCGKTMRPDEKQAGHYMRRNYRATRWMRENVHVQCRSCNHSIGRAFWSENINVHAEYRRSMVEHYGESGTSAIEAFACSGKKRPTVAEYRSKAEEFRAELREHGFMV